VRKRDRRIHNDREHSPLVLKTIQCQNRRITGNEWKAQTTQRDRHAKLTKRWPDCLQEEVGRLTRSSRYRWTLKDAQARRHRQAMRESRSIRELQKLYNVRYIKSHRPIEVVYQDQFGGPDLPGL
jgi:hypothetical protein